MWLAFANPSAHSGLAAGQIGAAVEALGRQGLRVDLHHTGPGGRTPGMVARALAVGRYEGLVVMGGDGSFHEVANGLLQSGRDLPLGVIPLGTGNNQARSLGLPLDDLDAAARAVARGRDARMDAGRLHCWDELGTERAAWFFDSIGFGFSARALLQRYQDCELVRAVPLLGELYRDEWVYAGAVTQALLASYVKDLRFDATVVTEHGLVELVDLLDLVINNTRVYARAWVLDARSRHDDGLMEIVPIAGRDEWLARAIVDLDGNPLREWVDAVREPLPAAARIDIQLHDRPLEPPIAMQVDGEVWPTVERARVVVQGGALRVRSG